MLHVLLGNSWTGRPCNSLKRLQSQSQWLWWRLMMVLTMIMMTTASFTRLPCRYCHTHQCLSGTDLGHAWHESPWSHCCQLHTTMRVDNFCQKHSWSSCTYIVSIITTKHCIWRCSWPHLHETPLLWSHTCPVEADAVWESHRISWVCLKVAYMCIVWWHDCVGGRY